MASGECRSHKHTSYWGQWPQDAQCWLPVALGKSAKSNKIKVVAQRKPGGCPNKGRIPTVWHLSHFVLAKVWATEHLPPKMLVEKVLEGLNMFEKHRLHHLRTDEAIIRCLKCAQRKNERVFIYSVVWESACPEKSFLLHQTYYCTMESILWNTFF